MKEFRIFLGIIVKALLYTVLLSSCLSDVDDELIPSEGESEFILSYNFAAGIGEWQTGFAEYPLSAEDTMQIDVDVIAAPTGLGAGDSLLRLSAIDPVSDLFSFLKLKVTGLSPNTTFNALIEIEFAAVNLDSLGTTYSGDQAVHLKAGLFEEEPELVRASDSASVGYAYNILDIEKGNDSDAGSDMVLLGSLNMPNPQVFTQLLSGNNTGEVLQGTTDNDGNIWLLIGVDSETQIHQAFYYSRVAVLFDELE